MIRLIEWLETLKLYKDPEDTLRFQYADALLIYSLTSCLGSPWSNSSMCYRQSSLRIKWSNFDECSRLRISTKWFLRDFQSWAPFVTSVSFKRRCSVESLTDDYIIRHAWNVSLWVSCHSRICSSPLWSCSSRSVIPTGPTQVLYDPVLLDLCYLQDLLKSTMTPFF